MLLLQDRKIYDLFWGQFVLSSELKYLPPEWDTRSLRGWYVGVNSLCISMIKNLQGATIGLIVGDAILPEGIVARGEIQLPPELSMEQFIDGLGGRYIVIAAIDDIYGHSVRVYPDPMASMGITYSLDEPIVASTPTLIQLVLGKTPEQSNVWDEFPDNRLGEGQSFPGNITADPQINKILPNHYLDLQGNEQHRYWPKHHIPYCSADEALTRVDVISSEIQKSISAICRDQPIIATLTAGLDSRMILACATPELREHMSFFSIWPTFDNPVLRVTRDAKVARVLAGFCKRPHILVPTYSPDDFDEKSRREYLYRIGYLGHWRKGSEFWVACEKHLPCSDSALMMGFGGEVTTYPFGKRPAKSVGSVTPEGLVHHLKYVPYSPRILSTIGWWLDNLPQDLDIDRLNDLFWIENGLSCLSLLHLYGVAAFRTVNIPFSQRRLIEASYQIPPEIRKSLFVSDELFARSDLPLSSVSVNGKT